MMEDKAFRGISCGFKQLPLQCGEILSKVAFLSK